MDRYFKQLVEDEIPKLNPILAGGLACHEVPKAMAYVDNILRASAWRFPEELTYDKIEVCTPEETVEYATRKRDSKRTYDVAVSYLRLHRLIFTLTTIDHETGRPVRQEIKRYLYLPFVDQGGEIFISGTRNFISPVLADKVISKQRNGIFVRLNSARPTFKEELHDMLVVDTLGRQTLFSRAYAYSPLHHQAKKTKTNTTMTHYLMCKYGYAGAFERFAGCVPKVCLVDQWQLSDWPPEQWVTVFSKHPMIGVNGKKNIVPNPFCLVMPRDDWETRPVLQRMVASFFYVTDVCSQQYHGLTADTLDEYLSIQQWCRNLGAMLYEGAGPGGVVMEKIQKHMSSLDKYLDEAVVKRLAEIGVFCNDIYEFFNEIETNIQTWMIEGADNINSIFGKELNVLTFLLYSVTEAITMFCFKLAEKVDTKNKKELTLKVVEDLMNRTLRPGLMFFMNKKNPEVQPGSVPGDNMATKTTAMMIPQSASSKGSGQHSSKPTPEQTMHVSVLAIALYCGMTKKQPDSRNRLNCYAWIDEENILRNHPDLDELLTRTQDIISGRRSITDTL